MFSCLQAICTGTQFNKVVDHQKQLHKKLVEAVDQFDFAADFDLQQYEIPPLPEKQPEDVNPCRVDMDAGSMRSGASRLPPPRALLHRRRDSKRIAGKYGKQRRDGSAAGSL